MNAHETQPAHGASVLLVDDDLGNRMTFAALLEDAGYRVTEAGNVAEARRRLAHGSFEMAILDLSLGDGLGTELVPELRRRTAHVVVALITGVSVPPAPGVDVVLVKGADPGLHLRTLESALHRMRALMGLRGVDPVGAPGSWVQRRVARMSETPRLGNTALRRTHSSVPAPKAPSGPAPKRGRILVVDDDPAARLSLQALLETEFDVETAADVKEAESRLARRSFDVVITDFEMPGEPGTALLERLQNRPGVVGMLLTGHADFDDVRRARNDPHIFQVLLKPYQPDVLLHRVRSALTIAHVRQSARP
jgi:DNA-binding NtrC family response regulator